MKKTLLLVVLSSAAASTSFGQLAAFVTDRFGADGTAQRYATMEDALAGSNPIDAPITIADRDLSIYITRNVPGSEDSNIVMGSWWYTTAENSNGLPKDDPGGDRLYSGYGNVRGNSGVGFSQLYDADASTDVALSMAFQNGNTEFVLSLAGANAGTDDFARFWLNDQFSPGSDKGVYITYSLEITAFGLNGVETSPGVIEATGNPTSVSGVFSGIFQNTSTSTPANNGFYVFDLTLNMDNWAFAQGNDALNGNLSDSYFAIPEPSTYAALLGVLALSAARILRRRRE